MLLFIEHLHALCRQSFRLQNSTIIPAIRAHNLKFGYQNLLDDVETLTFHIAPYINDINLDQLAVHRLYRLCDSHTALEIVNLINTFRYKKF